MKSIAISLTVLILLVFLGSLFSEVAPMTEDARTLLHVEISACSAKWQTKCKLDTIQINGITYYTVNPVNK